MSSELELTAPNEVKKIVSEWLRHRPSKDSSLILILRGLPGCGKPTFASFLKTHAEVNRLSVQVCSANDYFQTREFGYRWDVNRLSEVYRNCQLDASWSLKRGVDIVVIDNTNIRPDEWAVYEEMAYRQDGTQIHGVLRINFTCGDVIQATRFSYRRLHDVIPIHTIKSRFELFCKRIRFVHIMS